MDQDSSGRRRRLFSSGCAAASSPAVVPATPSSGPSGGGVARREERCAAVRRDVRRRARGCAPGCARPGRPPGEHRTEAGEHGASAPSLSAVEAATVERRFDPRRCLLGVLTTGTARLRRTATRSRRGGGRRIAPRESCHCPPTQVCRRRPHLQSWSCGWPWTGRSAKDTTGATPWRRSCSTSTTTAQSVVIGDGPCGRPRREGPSRRRQLPRVRHQHRRENGGSELSFGPVTDWATDLDHADPAYNRNAPEIWRSARSWTVPIAHTDRYHGMWVPLTHELRARRRLRHRALLQSQRRGQPRVRPTRRGAGRRRRRSPAIRRSQHARRILLPPSPRRRSSAGRPTSASCATSCSTASPSEGRRLRCRGAVRPAHPGQRHRPHARLPGRGRRPVPRFVQPSSKAVNVSDRRADARFEGSTTTSTSASPSTSSPRDDLISYLLDVEIDGEPLAEEHAGDRPPAAPRRHRHHLERDRLEPLAPRHRTPRTGSAWSPSPS